MIEKDKLTQIVKVVQQDIGEFELLYTHIIHKVYFWSYTVIGNETDAKDATQNAMIQIYQNIHKLKNPENFNSWMYRLVRNTSINYVQRYKKRELEFQENEKGESYEVNIKEERRDNIPEEAYDLKETKKLINDFIAKLPKLQREILTLYYLEEMKINEIASILNSSSGTIKGNLHRGRKNLEIQIEEYQTKNNVRLYTTVIIPLLGLILQEYQEAITKEQELTFNEKGFESNNFLKVSKSINMITTNIFSLISMSLIVVFITAAMVMAQFPTDDQVNRDSEANDQLLADESELKKKIEGNPYIESITYSTFPTRDSTQVIINMKKDISIDNIKVLFDNYENVFFQKDDKKIIITATENGEYSVIIENNKLSVNVTMVDAYAPEVVKIYNNKNYLQLDIKDEMSQINYEKSFVQYNDNQYQITKNNQVKGNFKGNIKVYIYNDSEQYICYEFNLK